MIRKVFLSVFICFLIISCNKKEDEVSQIEATSVSISEADVTISVGGREKLEIIVEPEGVDLSRSVWRSSDTNIVKVDEKGVVTARAEGKATVSYTTSNSLSKQCEFTVVSSPVSSLVLPDPDLPIGIGLKMFLMGQGFTSGQKIWFRPLQRGDGFKNCNDGDILGVIHEVASNYISVTGGVSGGWYSLLLESGGELFNLGNFQFATYSVPPFEYDPNKILWDDTHWRLFHLRGKVKRMVIQASNQYWTNYLALDFNSKGFLVRQCPSYVEDPLNSIYYEYDNHNRLIKKTGVSNVNVGGCEVFSSIIHYSYGNHVNYIDLYNIFGLSDVDFSYPYVRWFNVNFGIANVFYPVYVYYKGLVNVNIELKTNKGDFVSDMNIFVSRDSAYCNTTWSDSKYYFKWKFKDGFPISFVRFYDLPAGSEDFANETITEFNSNGSLKSIKQFKPHNSDTLGMLNYLFVPDKPYEMYSLATTRLEPSTQFEYNLSDEITSFSYISNPTFSMKMYYMSYDKYGNWTQCVVVNPCGVCTLYKREITYW